MTDAMRWGMHRGKRAITLDLREERDRSAYHGCWSPAPTPSTTTTGLA